MGKEIAELYESLLRALASELDRCREMLAALEEESAILRGAHLPELLASNEQKERVLLSLGRASAARVRAAEAAARMLCLKTPVALAELAAAAPDRVRERLTEQRSVLAGLLRRIASRNEANKGLIGLSLAHLARAIDRIGGLSSTRLSYDGSGQMKAFELQGSLISKAG